MDIEVNKSSGMTRIIWSGQAHLNEVVNFFNNAVMKIGPENRFIDAVYIISKSGLETSFKPYYDTKKFDTARFVMGDNMFMDRRIGGKVISDEHIIVRIDLEGLRRPIKVENSGTIILKNKYLYGLSDHIARLLRHSPDGIGQRSREIARQIRKISRIHGLMG